MKTIINLSGLICRVDDFEILEIEEKEVTDEILELLERKGYKFNGGWILQTEEEYLKED